MLDRDSLIISYDEGRGEPRGKIRKREEVDQRAHGDCIDCEMCVETCPTGIDIREGLQMECIGCAQCIDACDVVMDKIKRPRGLIRYSSQRRIEEKAARVLRPRLLLYPLVLLAIATAFIFILSNKQHLDVTILRGVGMPYVHTDHGDVANNIRIKIVNRTDDPIDCDINFAKSLDGAIIVAESPITIEPRKTITAHARIVMPPEFFNRRSVDVDLRITDNKGFDEIVVCRLLGPAHQPVENSRSGEQP